MTGIAVACGTAGTAGTNASPVGSGGFPGVAAAGGAANATVSSVGGERTAPTVQGGAPALTGSGGNGYAGASAIAGSPAAPTGVVGAVGSTCTPPGKLACAGNYQKLKLVCGGDGTWQPNGTCGVGQFCNSEPGVNVGICLTELTACQGTPNRRYCETIDQLKACGADALSTSIVETCTGRCYGAACDPFLEPCPSSAVNIVNYAKDCPNAREASTCHGGVDALPAIARLPKISNQSAFCVRRCGSGEWITFFVLAHPYDTAVKVTANAPAYLMKVPNGFDEIRDLEQVCSAPRDARCLVLAGDESVVVVTRPEAGLEGLPQNVSFEIATESNHCGVVPSRCDLLPKWVADTNIYVRKGTAVVFNGTIYEWTGEELLTWASAACSPDTAASWCAYWKAVGSC